MIECLQEVVLVSLKRFGSWRRWMKELLRLELSEMASHLQSPDNLAAVNDMLHFTFSSRCRIVLNSNVFAECTCPACFGILQLMFAPFTAYFLLSTSACVT